MAVTRRWTGRIAALCACAALCASLLPSRPAYAIINCVTAAACVAAAKATIIAHHEAAELEMKRYASEQFSKHEDWLINTYFKKQILPALQKFTNQTTAVDSQQAMTRGMFMDADNVMDTNRLYSNLQGNAYRAYQPSEDFCRFGTNVRSLASSETQSRLNASALSARSLSRQLGESGTAGATGPDADKAARWRQFTTTYCDLGSNNGDPNNAASTGMALACGAGPGDKTRVNKDIDYNRMISEVRTLDVNFLDSGVSKDEEDLQAFFDNLFPPLTRQLNGAGGATKEAQEMQGALRSIAAKRSVAQNSFNAIVGLKSAGTSDEGKTREYLAAIMKELGMKDDEIYPLIGEKPSYYAQLEIMAKRIYQSPKFYADLYDTPDNVERKAAALRAIELMVDRALYESQLRREMVVSVLLGTELGEATSKSNRALGGDSQ